MLNVLDKFIRQLAASDHLTDENVRIAVDQLVNEKVSIELKADFLCRLALKGETVDEIAPFALARREKSMEPPLENGWREAHEILDVCGTGGAPARTKQSHPRF